MILMNELMRNMKARIISLETAERLDIGDLWYRVYSTYIHLYLPPTQRKLIPCQFFICRTHISYISPPFSAVYLRLKYHVKANCCVSAPNGVGTSANPGLATGCLRYTAEQIF